MTGRPLLLSLLFLLPACGLEPLVHGLDEAQANEILLALDEGGVAGEKRREDGADGGWTVEVRSQELSSARRLLAERELPRPRPPGFGELFGEAGMVPTPVEEHARYLHALSGELSRTLEALDGVVEARVHLGLPQDDPLRPGERRPARAAILLRCRPAACGAVRGMEAGVRSLVAGAADGLAPDAVSLLVAEASPAPAVPAPARQLAGWRVAVAVLLALVAAVMGLAELGRRLPWRPRARGTP